MAISKGLRAAHPQTPLDGFAIGTRDVLSMHLCAYEGRHIEAAYYAQQALAALLREDYPAGVIAVRREQAKHAFRLGQSTEVNRLIRLVLNEHHDRPFVVRELLLTYIFATSPICDPCLKQAASYLSA